MVNPIIQIYWLVLEIAQHENKYADSSLYNVNQSSITMKGNGLE